MLTSDPEVAPKATLFDGAARLTICQPEDWHVDLRDDATLIAAPGPRFFALVHNHSDTAEQGASAMLAAAAVDKRESAHGEIIS